MSGHVLLNLLNELRKRDEMRGLQTSLINLMIQEHECKILFIILHYDYFEISFLAFGSKFFPLRVTMLKRGVIVENRCMRQ